MPCGLPALLPAVLALLVPASAADLVFRVPEVLVRHAAAARPVGTGVRNGSGEAAGQLEARYEEYFVEHDVSTAAARNAALHLDLDSGAAAVITRGTCSRAARRSKRRPCDIIIGCTSQMAASRVGCGACSRRDLEYCETRVLADHCCCERRFLREPFPWLPHTCYVGPGRCRPLAHDCVQYARLRDCCCYRRLAQRWKGILSKSARLGVGVCGASLLLLSVLLLAARL